MINPDLLLAAANKLIDRYHSGSKKLTKSDLPSKARMANLELKFTQATKAGLGKVDLAYEILLCIEDDPSLVVLDSRRLDAAKSIATNIDSRFQRIRHSRNSAT